MKISIVMPVYNSEKYLEECINSVLNQSSKDWELVIIDDGSTDNSGKICDNFAQQYSDKIFSYHKENQGQFLARQYGIERCTGDYIGFLDSDDILSEDYINEIIKCVIENKYPNVICFAFSRFNGTSNKDYMLPVADEIKLFEQLSERKEVYNHIINGALTGSMCSKVFSKQSLLNKTYDEAEVSDRRFAEDAYHSFSVIAEVNSICYLNKKLYFYRENPDGASEKFCERGLDYFNEKYVFSLIENYFPKWNMVDDEYKKMLYARNFNSTVSCMLKYYRSAKSMKRCYEIIRYNWEDYLLPGVLCCVENNEFIRKSYLKVWRSFDKNSYLEVFIREKFKRIIGW